MICIERDGNGFKIKVSDKGFGRYSVKARTGTEAVNSVAHYYGLAHDKSDCASCKDSAKDGKR